jgi:hypothetical protein
MKTTQPIDTPASWRTLKHHPLSALVEFGIGIDLEALAAHMRENGYDEGEPIITYGGKILDGRHKHKAALMAEVVPTFAEFIGKDPMQYVMKKVLRQHLNESQRAMFAATLATLPKGANQHVPDGTPSRAKAAEMLNVSGRSVARAKTVTDEGTPELQAAVIDGTVSLSDAATVAHEPPEIQNHAVDAVRNGQATTATKALPKFCSFCQHQKELGRVMREACPDCKALNKKPKEPSANGKKKKTLSEQIDEDLLKEEEDTEPATIDEAIKQRNSQLESFCRGLMKFVDDNLPKDEWLDYNNRRESAIQKFKDGCSTVRTAKCHSACPKCDGKGCRDCQKVGRVPKWQYDMLVG